MTAGFSLSPFLPTPPDVITSYSIHYTKLYEPLALVAHLPDEGGAVAVAGGVDVLPFRFGMDGQGSLAIHGIDIAGLPDPLGPEPFFQGGECLGLDLRVLVGFVDIPAGGDDPIPRGKI